MLTQPTFLTAFTFWVGEGFTPNSTERPTSYRLLYRQRRPSFLPLKITLFSSLLYLLQVLTYSTGASLTYLCGEVVGGGGKQPLIVAQIWQGTSYKLCMLLEAVEVGSTDRGLIQFTLISLTFPTSQGGRSCNRPIPRDTKFNLRNLRYYLLTKATLSHILRL